MISQNNIEHITEMLQKGTITAERANVLIVRAERIRIVKKLPMPVRKALYAAVKTGELGHMKADGRKPEVFYHPEFEYLANEARSAEEYKIIKALSAVCAERSIDEVEQ